MKLVDGLQQPVTIKSWEGAVLRPIIAVDQDFDSLNPVSACCHSY